MICKIANEKNMKAIILPHTKSIDDFRHIVPVYAFKHLDSLINLYQNYCMSRKIELPQELFDHLNFN